MQKFTKKNLKTGDIVMIRDGRVGVYIEPFDNVVFADGVLHLEYHRDDLTDITWDDRDIIRVRRPKYWLGCGLVPSMYDTDANTNIIYERKEPVEMTLEEICAALGKDIKIVKEK